MQTYKFTIMLNDYSKREEIADFENDDKAYSHMSRIRSDDKNVVAVTFSKITKPTE